MLVCIKSSKDWVKMLQTTFKNMIFQSNRSLSHTNRPLNSTIKVVFNAPTDTKVWHWDSGKVRWFHLWIQHTRNRSFGSWEHEKNKGKMLFQNYISNYFGSRRVVATDIAGRKKNIAHYLAKLPLECKDIFLFNHPASASEAVAYNWRIWKMVELEMISIVLNRSCSKHPTQWWCFQTSIQGQRPSRKTDGEFIKSGMLIYMLQLLNVD